MNKHIENTLKQVEGKPLDTVLTPCTSNADQLREIMRENELNSQAIADLIDVSLKTVRCWLLHSGSEGHRKMKSRELKFIKCLLGMK